MRRTAILTARTAIVLALAAAVFDLPLPARSSDRVRLHLIDRSDSVNRGPKDAPRSADADRIRAYDADHRDGGDAVLWASFGRDVAFESTGVDGTATDLAGALEAGLGRNPTEIVLYTDGRADPGRALLLCRTRGIPVHVFPLGGGRLHDARIAKVQVPAPAATGETVTVDVTVLSTFDGTVPVRMDGDVRPVKLAAGVPSVVSFPGRAPGPFKVDLDLEDECAENNSANGIVLEPPGQKRKVLVLSESGLSLPQFDVEVRPRFADPAGKDAVVLDNVALSASEQERLARWVSEFRGGLILLGGKKSYALGGWNGTPIDALSPLRSQRDQKVGVVFVIDCSGSMNQPGRLDVILPVVRAAWEGSFEKGDAVSAYAFPAGQVVERPSELLRLPATGGTNIADALETARNRLVLIAAPRRQIFLLTDGETSSQETPERRKQVGDLLARDRITLTVITVGRPLEIGKQVPLSDWKELERQFRTLLHETRETQLDNPGVLVLHDHPVSKGIPRTALPWINLTSTRPDAQEVGVVGQEPAVYPTLAFRQAGSGRVGAFAWERPDPALLSRTIDYVANEAAGGVPLTIDPPVVRARGDPAPYRPAWFGPKSSGALAFRQVLSDTWEAPLPAVGAGTIWVQCGSARAAVTVPCLPEYESLGVDPKVLARIASETGGRVLSSAGDLALLPRPAAAAARSGRAAFLVAALALLFLELALSTFWKA